MGNCFRKIDKFHKFKNEQLKLEYKNKKVSINKIGSYKPYSCYYSNSLTFDDSNIIKGLNSMCNQDIHIQMKIIILLKVIHFIFISFNINL